MIPTSETSDGGVAVGGHVERFLRPLDALLAGARQKPLLFRFSVQRLAPQESVSVSVRVSGFGFFGFGFSVGSVSVSFSGFWFDSLLMYVLRFPFNVLLAKARSYLRAFIPAEYTFPQNIPPRSAALLALKSYNFYITPPPMHDVWWGRFWSPADIPRLNNLALDLDFLLRVKIKMRFRRTSRTVLSTPPCLLCLLTGLLKSSVVAGYCQYTSYTNSWTSLTSTPCDIRGTAEYHRKAYPRCPRIYLHVCTYIHSLIVISLKGERGVVVHS